MCINMFKNKFVDLCQFFIENENGSLRYLHCDSKVILRNNIYKYY